MTNDEIEAKILRAIDKNKTTANEIWRVVYPQSTMTTAARNKEMRSIDVGLQRLRRRGAVVFERPGGWRRAR